MKKHVMVLGLYMLIMGAGLAVCNTFFGTTYASENFSEKFLPVMFLLAALATCYRWKNRDALSLPTENRPGYLWAAVTILPILGLGLYAAATNFSVSTTFFIALLDVVLIGIAEEGMYRGILLGGLVKKINPAAAIIVSAACFSLLHALNFLGGMSSGEVFNQMGSTFLMGLFLGAIYLETKKLYLPILFHSAWDYILLSGAISDSSVLIVFLMGVSLAELVVSIILLLKFRKMKTPVLH